MEQRTTRPWLSDAADAVARTSGVDRERLALSAADVDALLDVAGVAAHESGDRTNAPLICYLIGLAQGSAGCSLHALSGAVSGSDER